MRYMPPVPSEKLLQCGVILVTTTKLKWVWTIVGLLAAIVPLAAVMYCFIAAMAPLYDPKL